MKRYLDLVPISDKIHHKKSLMTRICIFLAVFLVTVIFGMADMEIRSQKIRLIADSGNWHIMLKNVSAEDAALITSRPEVVASSPYHVLNYSLKDSYFIKGKSTVICGFGPSFLEDIMSSESILDGFFPTNDQQVMLSENAKNTLGLNTGDSVTLNLPDHTSKTFQISGFLENTSSIMKADAIGIFMTLNAMPSLVPASGQLNAEHSSFDQDLVYYMQLSERCNMQKVIQSIKTDFHLSDKNLSLNNPLMATVGQSQDPLMLQLYGSAFLLFLLVLATGIFMIASSLNNNVTQRTMFFGMMRCLGATPKQIKRFVRLEALLWCKIAIPLGLLAGTCIVWFLCGLLRSLSATYFGELPVFSISWIGIIFGTIVGFLSVLIAANSPAKRASKVSPLMAVSGNASSLQPVKKAANTKFLTIDSALGFYHAKANKKNFFLMTGSFGLSIILFLSFSAGIDFMNHAIRPLKPYTPDLSIISADQTCSIDSDYLAALQKSPIVKRIYGRMFAFHVPVKISNQSKKVTLISYEQHQFNWAKKELVKGSIKQAMENNNSALCIYDSKKPLQIGDQIHFFSSEATNNNIDPSNNSDTINNISTPNNITNLDRAENNTMDSNFSSLAPSKAITISGILSTCPFAGFKDETILICSESTFRQLTGKNAYTILDIQLKKNTAEQDIETIRKTLPPSFTFSDQRHSNSEAFGAYLSFALFVYGFLIIIALITIFNIVNSISLSVISHMKQYGVMKAIGMSDRQLIKMITAETMAYSLSGCFFGCLLGLPIHKFLFDHIITYRWGDLWYIPFGILSIIIIVVLVTSYIAVKVPSKRIHKLSIVDTIS